MSVTSEELFASMQVVVKSISEVAQATNEGAEGMNNIAEKPSLIVIKANDVLTNIKFTKECADKPEQMVSKFSV